ncbi:MAG: hypothetical protein GTN40_00885 [Candidatus Aenigmarchaeota archaeon]|nr:hypothetical protein [Candidatus Aenigmarchaeota archaeon]
MHGQTRIEFIFAIVIFSIVIFYVVTQINTVFSSIISDYEIDALKAEALNSITNLVESELLANEPYNLSKEKIENLNQNCGLLDNFGIESYRLKIYNSTDLMLFCGIDSLKPPKVFVMKYVIIENDSGNTTLELW